MRIADRSAVGSAPPLADRTEKSARLPATPAAHDGVDLSALARLVRGGEHPADLIRELRLEVQRGGYVVPSADLSRSIVTFYEPVI